jgi:FkbM family methyltransferase
MLERIFKPHYLFRPRQAGRRLLQALSGALPDSVVAILPWGLPIHVDATDDIGRAIWQLGLYDIAVSETLWRLLAPGDLALDIGANIGYMTGLMARRAGPSGRVLSCEPHPEVFRRLTDNVRRLARYPSLAPVELFAVALGERIGASHLECGEDFARHRGTARITDRVSGIPVAMTTLDQLLGDRTAALVKIDVEGWEPQVFAGATRALGEGRVRSIVYEAHAATRQRIVELLPRYGYQIFGLGRNLHGLVLSGPGDPPRLPGYEPPSFLATLDAGSVVPRLAPRGWQVLRRHPLLPPDGGSDGSC